jgi:flavin-dependent dehydrogenase
MNDRLNQSEWDVAVIGAGPAGSFAAARLAEAGLRVLLAERKSFPRDKVCGGCLNARALSLLHEAGLQHVAHNASGAVVRVLSIRAARQSLEIPIPTGLAICRSRFDDGLANAASARGVEFVTGVTAKIEAAEHEGESTEKNRIRLEAVGQEPVIIRAKMVVLAGGLDSASRVAPHLLVTRIAPTSRIGAGVILPTAPSEIRPGTIHMSIANAGYAGAVCLSDGRLIVAAALDREIVRQMGSVAIAVSKVLGENGWGNVCLERENFHGTPPLTRSVVQPASERLFVIGDAAGYVEPFTGEGMASALIAAQAVVPYVIRGVERWDCGLATDWTNKYRSLIQGPRLWCRSFASLLRYPILTRTAISLARHWPTLPNSISRRIIGASDRLRSQEGSDVQNSV